MDNNNKLVTIVRRNLWSRGYSVKTTVGLDVGFDLLVEGKHKVKVGKTINEQCIIAVVDFDAAGRPVIRYRNSEHKLTLNPRVFFGDKKTNNEKETHKETHKETSSGKARSSGQDSAVEG